MRLSVQKNQKWWGPVWKVCISMSWCLCVCRWTCCLRGWLYKKSKMTRIYVMKCCLRTLTCAASVVSMVRCHCTIAAAAFIFTVCSHCAFSALKLLVGRHEEHPACKNWLMRCWCGCLSGARCWLVCMWCSWCQCIPEPHYLLSHLNTDLFYLSGTGLPRLSSKRGRWMAVLVVV